VVMNEKIIQHYFDIFPDEVSLINRVIQARVFGKYVPPCT